MGTGTEELSTTPSDIEATRANLTRDLDELSDKVSPQAVVQRQKDAVKDRIGSARDKVMGSSGSSGSSGDGPGTATQVQDSTQSAVAGHPLTAGLVAFGAGMLISALLPASKVETDAARQLTDAAKEHGQPLVDHAKSVAQEVGSDLKDSATAAADEVKSSAQDSAAQVKDEAQSSAATVKDDAKP